jgi:hypothetical protein
VECERRQAAPGAARDQQFSSCQSQRCV